MSDQERPRDQSMWYCSNCEAWNGYRLAWCLECNKDQPRFPLRSCDVDVDDATRVTVRDMVRGKVKSLTNGGVIR